MKKIIAYFVKYPVLGNAVMTLVALFGIFAFLHTKTNFFPDQKTKFITITSSYPGASPEEIEEGITLKIEDAIKGITGVDRTTSVSRENSATISVELLPNADANVVLQDVQSAVNSISSFPVGMDKLNVYKQEPREFVISLSLNGNLPLYELKKIAQRIERELLSKPEISKISLSGYPAEEIEVSFREKDLRAYGITFDQAANAIASANVKITGGKIRGDREQFLIRADNKKYTAEELKNHVLKTTSDGVVVYLKDVAEVSEKWAEDPNKNFFNNRQSVGIELQKTNQEDLYEITDIVKEYLADFNKNNEDVKLDITRDGSKPVRDRTRILVNNGMIGIVLVILFLGLSLNPRLAFWVAISIPISFLGMFAVSSLYGLTINVMSLLGMIIVIGILVDDGIVVAENIFSHYERGESRLKAAVEGTIEVLPSVITGVTTTILIFLVFFFLEGGLGERAKDIGFIVAGTLFFSLVEAMVILPAHIAHSKALNKDGKQNIILEKAENFLFWMRDSLYKPTLLFSMKHPIVTLTFPIALMIITIGAVKGNVIKTTFFPALEFNRVTVTLELPSGTSESIVDSLLIGIEDKAWNVNKEYKEKYPEEKPLIRNIVRNIGPNTHQGSLRITLQGSEERLWDNATVRAELRSKVGIIPEADKLQFGGGSIFGMPVSIALMSTDLNQIRSVKEELKNELRKFPELKDVVDDNPPGLREIKISLNENAYNLGLTTAGVMAQIRSGFFGKEAQRILRGIDEVRIWVRYAEDERKEIEQLRNMRIHIGQNAEIPLSELADIKIERGILSVSHIDGQRVIKVEADVASSDISVTNVISEVQEKIYPSLQEKYPDVTWKFEGESRESAKTINSIKKIVPSFLVLMFMMVVFTFRSFAQTVIVYIIIPFSFIGVLWGHYLQGFIFSLLSAFGAIALIGIVVNDSLVLISAFNRNLKKGLSFCDALEETGLSRFRPVILTSITTIAGLAPLIFEPSVQAQFLSPMAISVAYGLLVGTLLTLIMVPSMLSLYNKSRVAIYKLLGKEVTNESIEIAMIEKKRLDNYDLEA